MSAGTTLWRSCTERGDRSTDPLLGAEPDMTVSAAECSLMSAGKTLCETLRRGPISTIAVLRTIRDVRRLLDHAEWALMKAVGDER